MLESLLDLRETSLRIVHVYNGGNCSACDTCTMSGQNRPTRMDQKNGPF